MKRRSSVLTAIVAVFSLIALVGCSDSGGGEKADGSDNGLPTVAESDWVDMTGEDTVTIEARDNVFVPENVVVSPGTKIVFKNTGRNPHNVIPVDDADFEQIDVSKLQPKDEASISIDKTGEVPYYCSLHGTAKAGMKGRIKIAE